jgi:hypothetical protein
MFSNNSSDDMALFVMFLVAGLFLSTTYAIYTVIANRRMKRLLRSLGSNNFSAVAQLGYKFFERHMPDEREQGFPLNLDCTWIRNCCRNAIICRRFDEARSIFRMFPGYVSDIREEFERTPQVCVELSNRGLFTLAAEIGFEFYGSERGGTTWVRNMYKQAIAAKAGDEVVRLIEKFQFIIEEHQTWGSVMYAMARRSARDAHATS